MVCGAGRASLVQERRGAQALAVGVRRRDARESGGAEEVQLP